MKKALIVFLLFILVFVTSCSKTIPAVNENSQTIVNTPVTVPEKDSNPEEDVTEPEEIPEEPDLKTERSFLTGLPILPEEKFTRPVALVFNNIKEALPQWNISESDIVWECNMEGGITRLIAIYSDVSKIGTAGSVRSARDYFLDIASIHSAILVHAGGSPSAYTELEKGKVDNIDGVNMYTIPEDTFIRNSEKRYERGYEHCLETSGDKLAKAIGLRGYKTTLDEGYTSPFSFKDEFSVPDYDTAAFEVSVCHGAYLTTDFIYDDATRVYYKESFSEPHVDEQNGKQLAFENVLVLFASHKVVDEELRLSIDLVGEGEGIYITAGRSTPIKWTRESETSSISLYEENGEELTLNPGKTHITLFDSLYKNNITIK